MIISIGCVFDWNFCYGKYSSWFCGISQKLSSLWAYEAISDNGLIYRKSFCWLIHFISFRSVVCVCVDVVEISRNGQIFYISLAILEKKFIICNLHLLAQSNHFDCPIFTSFFSLVSELRRLVVCLRFWTYFKYNFGSHWCSIILSCILHYIECMRCIHT